MSALKLGLAAAAVILGSVAAEASCGATHVVKKGDTLSLIAAEHFGSIFEFERLYEANREVIGPDPNMIHIGDKLVIPCDQAPGVADWSVMPRPETLAHLLAQNAVQVLDIRDPDDREAGVIPGSISIPYALWRGPEDNLGEPPSEARIAELIGGAGLRLDRPIIVVHGFDAPMETGAAAVVYWILKSSGARQLAILRGGYAGWARAGLPVEERFRQARAYEAEVAFSWQWRVDEVEVFGIAASQIDGVLLDARPHDMFSRLDTVGRALASTLPRARSLPAPPLMSALAGEVEIEDGVDTVLAAFRELGADGSTGPVVTFCHVGELGALNWFYASELGGLPNIKLYPESVNGWTFNGGRLFPGRS